MSRTYGIREVGDLFTPRQCSTCSPSRSMYTRFAHAEMLKGEAIERTCASHYGYLGMMVIALLTSVLLSARGTILADVASSNTFARQAVPMVWDFAETNPFNESRQQTGRPALRLLTATIRLLPSGIPARSFDADLQPIFPTMIILRCGNHRSSLLRQCPLLESVGFLLRLAEASVGFLYPEHFSSQLTPKKRRHNADASIAARKRTRL